MENNPEPKLANKVEIKLRRKNLSKKLDVTTE